MATRLHRPSMPAPIVFTLVLIVLALVGCRSSSDEDSTSDTPAITSTTASTSAPTTAAQPTATSQSLEQVLSAFVGEASGGVEVLIARGGDTQHVAVGTASNDGEALTPGRPFRVGSISKPFVAVMVLQLADEGRVDLDALLGDYLPDTPVGAESTVRQLLSHQSGIPNYTDQPAFVPDLLADPSHRFTTPEILQYVEEVPPGQADHFAYSNTNYILLGQLVEHLDGTELNTSLRQRITEPLGLQDTRFDTGDGQLVPDLVAGWSGGLVDGDPDWDYTAVASSAWAAGSLVSTSADLAAFLEALAAGQLISPESFAGMTDVGSSGYGLGISSVNLSPTQGGYGHSGSIPGYSSTMAIDPTTGDLLVILTNNDALMADRLAPDVLAMD